MSFQGIRDAMKTAFETVSGVRGYSTVPDKVECPCAWPIQTTIDYEDRLTQGTGLAWWEVTVLVRRGGDVGEAQDTMDGYLDLTGSGSLKTAIEAASLGSHGSGIGVQGARDYGAMRFAGKDYVGFKLDVWVSLG